MMRRSAMAMALLVSTGLGAQERPSTDVWLIPMSQRGRVPAFGEPVNVTRRTGYDNQPSFTPAGDAVLYTVIGADGASDIWRALAKVPGRDAVTFLQQVKDSLPWIAEVDVRTKSVRRVAQAPPGADYHAWTPNGALLATAGSRIFVWTDGRWDVAADLGRWGTKGMTRLAVSPTGDWLAFVAEDDTSP